MHRLSQKYDIFIPGGGTPTLGKWLEMHEGKRILLIFRGGFGDFIMFRPVLAHIRVAYSHLDIQFGALEKDQCHLVEPDFITLESFEDPVLDQYDCYAAMHIIWLSEGSGMTKPEWYCHQHFGFPRPFHLDLPKFPNPLVAVHFQGTCIPEATNPPEEVCRKIWADIVRAGFVPIECHFLHYGHNADNVQFDFIERSVRGCRASPINLIGLIQNCFAFVGVSSGPFHVAVASLPPERICFLGCKWSSRDYTHLPVHDVKTDNYTDEVYQWLSGLQNPLAGTGLTCM